MKVMRRALTSLVHRRVDHVIVVGGDLLMQALGRMRQQVAVLVTVQRCTGTPSHTAAIAASRPGAIDDEEPGPPAG
jgi:hypothetical protein